MSTSFSYFRDGRPSQPPTLSISELDRDPHSLFRRMRLMTPFLRRDDGSHIAIRSGDVERLYCDTRTHQMETERLRARGIHQGYLYDIFRHTMLYANGTTHRQRRAPLSRDVALAAGWQLLSCDAGLPVPPRRWWPRQHRRDNPPTSANRVSWEFRTRYRRPT